MSSSAFPHPSENIAVVVAHPDDEVIGAGARLCGWRGARIVHVTDGAPRDMTDARRIGLSTRAAYADLRRRERAQALALAGIEADHIHDLDRVDGEAIHDLVGVTADLVTFFRAAAPSCVVTHPYEGGHPDHDATAFAVHAALRLLAERGERHPFVVEMASYHAGPMGICTGHFLHDPENHPSGTALGDACPDSAREIKRQMLGCYSSQRFTLRYFDPDAEPLRAAPGYDFSSAPHSGTLFYEHFDWGCTGPAWRALARDAARELGLGKQLCH